MTPVAHKFAKQLTLPVKKRDEHWRDHIGDLKRLLEDIHCFECSAAIPAVMELRLALGDIPDRSDDYIGTLSFLPAPRTWIEWKLEGGDRVALHLSDDHPHDREKWIGAILIFEDGISPLGLISRTSGDINFPGGHFAVPTWLKEGAQRSGIPGAEVALYFLAAAQLLLVLINTPRIIGRKQHMPHRGLEKELTKAMGRGKFPLHAWTEILLDVTKPTEIDDGEPHEAHLTGRRALHFCRAHLRIRLGKLEYVTSHWRGDPALGIKQSRYTLTV